MVLSVRYYGDPILRKKGERIEEVTPEIRQLISDMFETMHENHGIGLAAQQVGKALQLTVIDVRNISDRPSSLWVDGQEVEVDSMMPLVLINPEITPDAESVQGAEGCLSFPELYGYVQRPESVAVSALNREGEGYDFKCSGLLARVVQHETDHLNGILFVDRMTPSSKKDIQEDLDRLYAATKASLKKEKREKVNVV